jgi:hypothetical protein
MTSESDIHKLKVADYMTTNLITIQPDACFQKQQILWPLMELAAS